MADNTELLLIGMENIGRNVDTLVSDMQYVKGELIRNEEWHNSLNKDVKDIHDAVHGNGKPGLSTELACVSDMVVDIDTRLASLEKGEQKKGELSTTLKLEWLKGWRSVLFTAITALITTIIALGLDNVFRVHTP